MSHLLNPDPNNELEDERNQLETLLAKVRETDGSSRLSTYDDQSEFEASAFDEDFEEVVDDLATYIDCLMDLTPALENPASDYHNQPRQTRPIESFDVSTALAANYCRKIRDRFTNLDIKLVERLGEANALRKQRLQQRPEASQGLEKAYIDIDVDPESEPIFSDAGRETTTTTGSTFPTTQPSESIFDRPFPKKLPSLDSMSGDPLPGSPTISENDTASQATFASFSTTSSTKSQGRPRIPPLPVEPGSGKYFTCVACGQELLATRTRRAWK